MSDLAIRVQGMSKQYDLGELDAYETLRDTLARTGRRIWQGLVRPRKPRNVETFWALKDISFDVKPGEVVGIVGRNGAGKSTLLKILSRITEPSEGHAELRGRVGSLLEVGTGFHPELTGRENIHLNGAILGMTRAEINRRFDEIVAFSEIEKFLDTPVKRYSSGMYVRLAFAVAAHLEPEILIVDEVLAVGDQSFQNKCLGKMSSVAHQGRTILFVSHNMAAIEALCDSAVLLQGGKITAMGDTGEVIGKYLQDAHAASYDIDLAQHAGRVPGDLPLLRRLRIADGNGAIVNNVQLGQPVTFEVEVETKQRLPESSVAIHMHNSIGLRVTSLHSKYQYNESVTVDGRALFRCRMDSCQLMPGSYSIILNLNSGRDGVDRIESGLGFEVMPRDVYGTGRVLQPRDGVYVPDAQWQVEHFG